MKNIYNLIKYLKFKNRSEVNIVPYKPRNNEDIMDSTLKINWEYIQKNSNDILAEGLSKLACSPYYNFGGKYPKDFGNYIISHGKVPLYIGEATNINKRLKEHYRGNTFYKNYKKYGENIGLPIGLEMDAFQVQYYISKIGRKEIEEFGIVNLPAPLNKFQKNKREKLSPITSTFLWDDIQVISAELLHQAEIKVLSQQTVPWKNVDIDNVPGVYLIFNSNNELIYIGESTGLYDRYVTHSTDTRFSAFRRHVAVDLLSFKLKTKQELGIDSTDKRKKSVTAKEDQKISQYVNECHVIIYQVSFGRGELEEYLIRSLHPLLNSKGNK